MLDDARSPCGGEVGACAAARNAGSIQRRNRVSDPDGSAVGDVISGQGHRVKARVRQRRDIARVGAGRGHIAAHFRAMAGVWDFEVTDGDVDGAQRGRDAGEPVFGPRLIEYQIAGEDEIEAHHMRRMQRPRPTASLHGVQLSMIIETRPRLTN